MNAYAAKSKQGKRPRGEEPGGYWEIFIEVKAGKYGYKFLLVVVDTFSGLVETFPTNQETAAMITKEDIRRNFPKFGVPKVIGSDNGPAFVS